MSGIVNTPGYYYSIAYILAAFIVTGTNRDRLTGWKRRLVQMVFSAVLVSYMWITDGVRQTLFLPAMVVTIAMILFYLYACDEFTFPEAGYYCARAFISGEFAASLCWQIFFYTKDRFLSEHVSMWRWGELVVVYGIIFTVIYLIERGLCKDGVNVRINRRELMTVIVITIAVFAVSNMSYLDQNTLFSSPFAGEMFAIRTLVDLSGMAVCIPYPDKRAADEIRGRYTAEYPGNAV